MNPTDQRLAAQAPDGVIAQSGVSAFRRRYLDPSTAEKFFGWTNLAETKLAKDVLRDLALHGPVGMANPPQDTLVQYGMTLGLQLALQILDDPSLVFPEVFRGQTKAAQTEELTATFDTNPEDVF